MSDSEARDEVVVALADEFLQRYRQGERPSLKEYIDRHPDLADEIREVLPAMAMMERIAIADESLAERVDRPTAAGALEQLGDYRIIREVGRGGMGIVYEAEQVSLGRHVALKVLPNNALIDAKHKRRFEREAKSAARLHHTNIVPVFGVGEQNGLPYYVMQFIQGLGLNDVMDELIRQQVTNSPAPPHGANPEVSVGELAHSLRTGMLKAGELTVDRRAGEGMSESPTTSESSVSSDSSVTLPGQDDAQTRRKQTYWQSIANVGIQVASALDYAHDQGILHRDIKPSNLLLDRHGTVWVTDFGLAKADGQENLTQTGDILGTIRYMPPEAFEGLADRRGDIYSLGITLYELLAMRPAFGEKDRNRLISQVSTMEPVRLDILNPTIPRDLVTIVHKAIERTAGHRYACANELAADLRRFLADEPILARPISTTERLWRWSRRRPAAAAAISLAALLLVVLVALPLVVAVTETKHSNELAKQKTKVEEALRESRRQSAVLTLERALIDCEQGEVARGLLMLAKGLQKSRDAEAPDLEEAFRLNLGAWSRENHELLHVLNHGANVRAVAFSPDGTLVASGGADNRVRLWHAATGLPHGSPLVHPGAVQALAFHPDGRLLTGCEDGEARIWDLATSMQIGPNLTHYHPKPDHSTKKEWPFQQGISSLAFSPNGRDFITGGFDGSAKRWDTASGKQLGKSLIHGGAIFTVAYHSWQKCMLTAGLDWNFRTWDFVSDKPISNTGTGGVVWQAAFHPSGNSVAMALQQQQGVGQWKVKSTPVAVGSPQPGQTFYEPFGQLLKHFEMATAVAYTPDGTHLLTGSMDRKARFWDSLTGRPFGPSLQHKDAVLTVAVSPDNRLAVTGGSDSTARLWQIARGSKRHTLHHSEWVRGGPTFDRESKTVLTESGGVTGEPGIRQTAGSPLRNNKVVRWDVTTGKRLGPAFANPKLPKATGFIHGIALSPDGQRVYAADHLNEVVHFWHAESGLHIGSTPPHGDQIWRLVLSPDGQTLITGTHSFRLGGGSARLWNARTGEPIGDPLQHEDSVFGLAFHPNRQVVLTGSNDRTTRLWDATTGKPLGPPLVHRNAVKAVAFRHDGLAVALGSADRTAQIWDPATWKPVGPAMQHEGELNSVTFDPKGNLLLTSSTDRTARIWHVATGKSVGPALRHAHDVRTISCSPDGRIAATISQDQTAGLWAMPVPVTDDSEQVWRWAQRITGQTLGEDGAFHVLSQEEVAQLGFAGKDFDHQGPREHDFPLEAVLRKALKGEPAIKDAAGLMEVAGFAVEGNRLFGTSTRLFEISFKSHPEWMGVKVPGWDFTARFYAAGVAAAAAAGQGDAAQLNPSLRASWNRQAVAWMLAELQDCRKRLEGATPQAAEEAVRLLDVASTDKWLLRVLNQPNDSERPMAERESCWEIWVASAHVYADAFAIDAKLADNMKAQCRYDAACFAARAGCWRIDELEILKDGERARLRKQAVAWLRADLAHWKSQAETTVSADRMLARTRLRRWQVDSDLAGLRGVNALAILPAEEAEACRRIWAEVAEVLKSTEK